MLEIQNPEVSPSPGRYLAPCRSWQVLGFALQIWAWNQVCDKLPTTRAELEPQLFPTVTSTNSVYARKALLTGIITIIMWCNFFSLLSPLGWDGSVKFLQPQRNVLDEIMQVEPPAPAQRIIEDDLEIQEEEFNFPFRKGCFKLRLFLYSGQASSRKRRGLRCIWK